MRRIVAYLDAELARALRVYAAEADRDVSAVVSDAVAAYLRRRHRG